MHTKVHSQYRNIGHVIGQSGNGSNRITLHVSVHHLVSQFFKEYSHGLLGYEDSYDLSECHRLYEVGSNKHYLWQSPKGKRVVTH